MPELPPRPRSLWMATSSRTSYPRLAEELRVDVAVVGGGIAGMTTALLCKEAGRSVAVLEADRVGTGATAHSTVKVTSGHGAKYHALASTHGADAARLYADANQSAVGRIAEHVTRLGIACDWEWKRHCMWADTPEEADLLRQELEAQRAAGLPVSFATDVDLPFPTEGALQLDQQGQFHPQRYVAGIARHVSGAGCHVFERTKVNDVEVGDPCRVITDDAAVLATDVVIATHFPIVDPALILTRATPQMEYAVASKIDPSRAPSETYINVGSPTRSIRTATAGTDCYLIVVGEGHKVGEETDTLQRYRALADWAAQRFGATSIEYMWSTHDYDPVDGLPLIGPMTRATPHLMVATGFGRWGMTTGTVAAMVLSDHIAGRENPWASLFDPREHHVRGGTMTFVSENVKAILGHWVGDRLRTGSADLAELAPGAAAVVRIDGEPVAAYRDDAGELHAVSAVCTHVGCLVSWNNAERTWDCPCHGSRFGVDGSVIGGPANRPLDQKHI